MLIQLGITLKSNPAREFQAKVRKIFKGFFTGDLRLMDMRTVFNNIGLIPTKTHRQNVNNYMLKSGIPSFDIETRTYNVKLTTELKNLLQELGLGGQVPHVWKEFAKVIYPQGICVFDESEGVVNPHLRRDYCNANQWMITQVIDRELFRRLLNHDGKLSKIDLYKYVEQCVQMGITIRDNLIENDEITIEINNRQSALDEYFIR